MTVMTNVAFIRPEMADMIDPASLLPSPPVKKPEWPEQLGSPPSIEMRHPNELQIDDSYQRPIDTPASQTLIKRIARGWDWRKCQPLVVSRRDAGLFVIDGQHRLEAALMRNAHFDRDDIRFIPCCISTYASVAEEAAMFVEMNRVRKKISLLDDHHAAVAAGDEDAIAINRIVTGAGLKVSRRTGSQSWVPGEVAFTASIGKIARKHGEKVCADAMRLIAEAFPGEVLNAGASVFRALTKLAVAGEALDHSRLFRALQRFDQKGWASFVLDIKGGGEDRALALRQALLMAYEEAA